MKTVLALVLLAALCAGCGPKRRVGAAPLPPPRSRPSSIPVDVGHSETGIASWYGYPYHGRQAASGEIYDMEQMTAAHRTLPFQTWVRVENLTNSKTVEVRITDRGPFIDGRIIDLSRAAARAIDLISPGTARVRLEVVRSAAPVVSETVTYGVQVGAFRDRANAERARERMESRYGTARLAARQGDTVLWRVLVGAEPSEDSAIALSERIRQEIGERNAFVVRLDNEWFTASSAGRR